MDITELLPARDTRGTEIQGIVMDTLRYQSKFVILEGANIVDFGAAAGTNIFAIWILFKKWRVAGIGWRCSAENFTDDEDPEMTFGSSSDADLYGKIKVTYPAAEKMAQSDVASYDNLTPRILGSILVEAATGITFTAGDPDGSVIWQTAPGRILVENVAQLTTGKGYPFVLVEVSRV